MRALFFVLLMAPLLAVSAEIRIAVSKTPLSLPLYVAKQQGYFAEQGLQVEFIEVIGGNRAFSRLIEGQADYATTSETVVAFNSFKYDNFSILSSFVSTNQDIKLLIRNAHEFMDFSDFSNKTVGTVLDAASHYYLDTLLMLNGVDPRTVDVIKVAPENMETALSGGEVDAVAIWQPYVNRLLDRFEDAQILEDDDFYSLDFLLLSLRDDLHGRRTEIQKILQALYKAEQFINASQDAARNTLKNALNLDKSMIDYVLKHYKFELSLNQSLLSTMESEARWAIRAGDVPPGYSPDFLQYIFSLPLKDVHPVAVTLIE